MKITWDDNKQKSNIAKHSVSFTEAISVFLDDNALLIHDPDHSIKEDRFILLGMSSKANVLTVCHCYRNNDEVIRIINARKASLNEKRQYYNHRGC